MKTDLSLTQLTHGISRILHRYHAVIFTLVVLGGLSIATFILYREITSTPATEQTSESVGFDKQTIEDINSLRASGEASKPLVKPAGRTNPFQ
jgi:ABC-type dipeptide/oligopeptide/nickel transport system permease component